MRQDAEGPGAPGLAFAGGVAAAEAAILAITSRLHPPPGARVAVGAAGALSAPTAPAALADRLLLSLGATSVGVTSDAVTAHAGALGGTVGVVLAVGTGAVAAALGPAGFVRVDGHGPWLGDAGSAAAIGLAGLRAVLRAMDGSGPATALTAAAERCYGTPVSALPALIGNTPDSARQAARFAPRVTEAADRGDAEAASILDGALHSLSATVRAAAERSGLPPPAALALTGGLLRAWPALPARLLAATTRVRIVPATGTALDGARLLATDQGTTAHETLVSRRRAPAPSNAGKSS